MYTVLLSSIVGFALGFFLNGCELSWYLLPSPLFGAFVGVGVALCVGEFVPRVRVEESTQPLRGMRTIDSLHAIFVMGSGSVRGQSSYRLLIVNEDGSVSPFTIQATTQNTRIFESESEGDVGSLKVTRLQPEKSSRLARWAFCDCPPDQHYEIRVPKGSVCNTFQVE